MSDEKEAEFVARIQQYAIDFNAFCQARHEMGAEKYGPVKFATIDTLQMAMEEVADLANYAMYTYIKLRLLQDGISTREPVQIPGIHGWRADAQGRPDPS